MSCFQCQCLPPGRVFGGSWKTSASQHRFNACLSALLLMTPAHSAQLIPTPGSVQQTLSIGKPIPAATPAQVLFPVQPSPSAHERGAKRFRVNAFRIRGNTLFTERSLKRLLERFVDMELNLYEINRAADVITGYYHDHGYMLARAFVPAQKVDRGVVSIELVEGRISKITFSGNKRYAASFLAARTRHLSPGMLVTTGHIENDLMLMNDLPGISAKAVMEPGSEFGTTDAEIKVNEQLLSGRVTMSNQGRKETGQNRVEAAVNLNAPFGWGDQMSLSGIATERELIRYWKAGYSFPLNTLGTRLSLGRSMVEYNVSGNLAALGISGVVKTSEIILSHPFVRSRAENQNVSLMLNRNQLIQTALGVPMSNNAYNLLTGSYAINQIHDDTSVTSAMLSLASNFRNNHDSTSQNNVFAKTEVDVNHTAPLYGKWDLYLRGDLVHSRDTLPDNEKFALGGPGSVRAFRPSELRGDGGYLVTMELRRPLVLASRMGTFRVALDSGEVVYKKAGFTDSRDSLKSVGLGMSLYPGKGIVLSADLAVPFATTYKATDSSKGGRVWVNLTTLF